MADLQRQRQQQQQAQQQDLQQRQQELDCLRLETEIMRALNARDLRAAQALLGQAGAMGCAVSASTQSAVREAISRQSQMARDQQTQQALAQFARDWQRLMQAQQQGRMPLAPQVQPPSPIVQAPNRPSPQPGPAPRMGQYEPRGTGRSCAAEAASLVAQCERMNKDSATRKCQRERGGQSCALDFPGCGTQQLYNVMAEGSCLLHPSYAPSALPLAQSYLQEVRGCVERFFADHPQAGAYQRGYACTQAAGQRTQQAADQVGARACEARCADDGGQRNRAINNRCECLRPGGRP